MAHNRPRQEAASIARRVIALVLLPILLVVLLVFAVIVAILIVIGGIVDVLQFVFFGTTGVIEWIGSGLESLARTLR